MARIFRKLAQLLDVDLTSTPPEDGDALTYDAGSETWVPGAGGGGGGGGAPTDATYLVTTASGDLDAEVVVGATPGGELGGTWASPTVDATHSGSSHASVQAAAEATAAGALSAHSSDTTGVHGITNTANLIVEGDSRLTDARTPTAHKSSHENNGSDEISVAGLSGELADPQPPKSHTHAATDVTVADSGGFYAGTDVEAVLAEIAPQLGGIPASLLDAKGDLIVASAADTAARLAVGATNGMVLTVASGETTGRKDAYPPGFELAYAEITADVTVSATAEATPNDVVSAGAVVFDGSTRICIEFFTGGLVNGASGSGAATLVNLWQDSTDLGRLAGKTAGTQASLSPCLVRRFLTPTAGSKTFSVKAWRSNANGSVLATAPYLPAYIRITVA